MTRSPTTAAMMGEVPGPLQPANGVRHQPNSGSIGLLAIVQQDAGWMMHPESGKAASGTVG
ncbi:MAG: hypothetical protein M3Q03_14475 [Chloroflexota bacterium]|nr:hypothetical protein [Chloroflexota bacterium]